MATTTNAPETARLIKAALISEGPASETAYNLFNRYVDSGKAHGFQGRMGHRTGALRRAGIVMVGPCRIGLLPNVKV